MNDYPLFRVIIAGTREFRDYGTLRDTCNRLLAEKQRTHDIVVVSGTARGADSLGERYARERGYQLRRFPADWERYGKAAGYRRNSQMADNADALIAFWDGQSRGTKNMIEMAKKKKLEIRIVNTSSSNENDSRTEGTHQVTR